MSEAGAGTTAAGPVPRRLHPLTPALRSWALVPGFAVFVVASGWEDMSPLQMLAGFALLLVVGGLAVTVSWWRTTYRIDSGELRVDNGLLFRRSRRVRIDRLQSVDIQRPLVARIFGLAELKLEVAGSGTEAPLAYLTVEDAQRLRAELLASAAGLHVPAGTPAPVAYEQVLVTVPFSMLLKGQLLSVPVITGLSVVALGVWLAIGFRQPGFLAVSFNAVLVTGGLLYERLVREYGFTLAESADGLRIRRGLLDELAQTVPPGRIQGVSVRTPLLWRIPGWVRLQVDVAGYGAAATSAPTATLLPVAPVAVARFVLAHVLPGTDYESVALSPAPARAAWFRPIGWRYLGWGWDEHLFVARRGWLHRVVDVVPHAKMQSVRITQGPLQRRLRLADVHVDTPPGPVNAVAKHLDAAIVGRVADEQAVRSAVARRRDVPERWLR